MKFILASKSLRRIELLKKEGYHFIVKPANINEKTSYKNPKLIVKELAYKKAITIAKKYPNIPVLSADTIVYCKNKVIGKPKNKNDAFNLLKLQSGSWQSVYSGVCLIWISKNIFLCDFEKSKCYMRKLTNDEIKKISSKHLDKAGGWAVQDGNDLLITKIKGRYDNVVGLPLNIVKKFINRIKKI